ncbi:sugar phosphate nucleotidyltransferase [Alicyclobacillus herbarius]|uniref:sugar phosphate nucleotidyltransferase n=1 Tax=Alicyclobacillus herbarius TaxID=122960 RepID=UPI0003F9BD2D|nr:sugar phosphate nucleotidyltransferase [Alicyclobacillus herbarius]
MKAVILAGGKGTRLRPLTWNLPKPMVPLLDRPCMEYILDLLKRHGITDIAVTVQYLPQVIKSHFGDGSEYGVRLHYFEEDSPLGTAGSVKNAQAFFDDTFIVISGDALTDFHLGKVIDFHKTKQAAATIVMTRVEVPIEYGVVMTDEDGRIIRFLEKPSWSEVFSNTVNTGIYVLEPKVLNLFEEGKVFDFSKDLFPLLMREGYPFYGYVADGYWSDIGNLVQYRQTQFDMLDGQVDVQIKGRQIRKGVWVAENAEIHPTATIVGPAFIGEGTVVGERAELGAYSVIGRFNRIYPHGQMERSVIWNRTMIGPSASVSGSTVCTGVKIGIAARLQENAVIGENSKIGDKADIHANVKVWPNRYIEADTIQRSSLIWGKTSSATLFEQGGISGVPNLDLTPEFVGKLISAYAACLDRGAVVTVSSDDEPYSQVIKFSAISSLLAAGIHVRNLGTTLLPLSGYGCRMSQSDGGIHIYGVRLRSVNRVCIRLFDRFGQPLSKGLERKIENAFFQEDYARPDIHQLGYLQQVESTARSYTRSLLSRVDKATLRQRRLKVVYGCHSPGAVLLMNTLLEQMGCIGMMMTDGEAALPQNVVELGADLGIYLKDNGESYHMVTDKGHVLNEHELQVLRQAIRTLEDATDTTYRTGHPAHANSDEKPVLNVSFVSFGDDVTFVSDFDAFYSSVLLLNHLARSGLPMHEFVAHSVSVPEDSAVGIP